MKKTTLALVFVLLSSAMVGFPFANSVTAQTYSSITIEPDGSTEEQTKPIKSLTKKDHLTRSKNLRICQFPLSSPIAVEEKRESLLKAPTFWV